MTTATTHQDGTIAALLPRKRRERTLLRSLAPAAMVVAVQLVLFPLSQGLFVKGVILGGLTALIALGMAITYRSNRIVNFAQGDLGTPPVVVVLMLLTVWHWPYLVAVLVGAAVAVALGAVVELAVIRRFFRAPRLLLTVATLGLAQLLAGGAILLPKLWGSDPLLAPRIDAPFDFDFTVGHGSSGVIFHANDLIALIVTPIAVIVVALLLRSSGIGIAVRASADDADRASLLGVPVKRLQTIVWSSTALLAFVAVFLRAGVLGLPIDSALSFDLLLRSLAAMVLGGMTDLVAVTAAAVALGVLESGISYHVSRPQLTDVFFAAVIFVALLVIRARSGRSSLDDASTWLAVDDARPVPERVSRLNVVRLVRWGGGALVLAAAVALPTFLPIDKSLKASALLIYAVLGLSLVVLTGWAGQISLGQVGFFALGAAVGAKATNDWNLDLSIALVISAIAGAAAAGVIGLPALRRRGLYLAVITLACSVAMTSWLLSDQYFDWVPSPNDRIQRPDLFGQIGLSGPTAMYELCLAVLIICLVALHGVRRSRTGRALLALRDNERGAQAFGLDPTRVRLTAFAMSGALAAVAGCLLVHHQQAYDPQLFSPFENLRIFTMVIVGGVATPIGAVFGALFLQGTKWFLPTEWQVLSSGVGVLLVVLVLPYGFGGLLYRVRDWWFAQLSRSTQPLGAEARAGDAASEPAVDLRSDVGPPLLAVHDLDVKYGPVQVLFEIDLDIIPGTCVALLGTNGAGKSTLLKAICGIVEADRGTVTFDGREITNVPAHQIAALGITQVPGGRGIFPSLTVEENLRTGSWMVRRDKTAAEAGLRRAHELFPILAERRGVAAGDLSGGQQQMLAIAMAFLVQPKLLLIDELSLGLAPAVVAQLLPVIEEIRANGTTVVLVEQSVNVALTVADTAVFMEKGEIR
ncbi:MAG: hypothetical protein QOE63_906, partial [Acidimicrobiaceae bacterium]